MTLIIVLPLLFAVAGAFVFALSKNADAKELGRITYFVGLFFTVSALATHVFKLG